ncbi:short chain dehydrogenase domain-containing protein [Phthorimaea operculella]|nr:short chain dehydrogenase domain-containing protein [Phthorimaea operculella]
MSRELEGKVALVTGASAGIGEATALLLSRRGARVALVGRDEAALAAVAARCGPAPGALPLVADLATDAGCELVARRTLEHFGRYVELVPGEVGKVGPTGLNIALCSVQWFCGLLSIALIDLSARVCSIPKGRY